MSFTALVNRRLMKPEGFSDLLEAARRREVKHAIYNSAGRVLFYHRQGPAWRSIQPAIPT